MYTPPHNLTCAIMTKPIILKDKESTPHGHTKEGRTRDLDKLTSATILYLLCDFTNDPF
jgi:hypothetical protein